MSQEQSNHVCAERVRETGDATRCLASLQEQIQAAGRHGRRLVIEGGGTRSQVGGLAAGERLSLQAWQGVVQYEPDDLVITVRAGTSVAEVQHLLAQQGQMLAFEPPLRTGSTIGGTVALGWSGPRRPFAGALRDHLLGVRMLDGLGRELRFGGQVVKNVAGFDVARLMAGSMGILGPLLEMSLRVMPRPALELTTALQVGAQQALQIMQRLPIGPGLLSAAAHVDGYLYLRSAGAAECVHAFLRRQGGTLLDTRASQAFWQDFTHQRHGFFSPRPCDLDATACLWRVSVRPGSPELCDESIMASAIDWAGALRWVWAPASAAQLISQWAQAHGGYALLWPQGGSPEVPGGTHAPLSSTLLELHRRIKGVFDPHGIFNVGRMFAPR